MAGLLVLLQPSLEPSSTLRFAEERCPQNKKQEETEAKFHSRGRMSLRLDRAAQVVEAVTVRWPPAMAQGAQGHAGPRRRCLRWDIPAPAENPL